MPYRLEYAKSDRGSCKMAACQKRDAKIPKGGLKFGNWIDGGSKVDPFFVWRHWGCVTDKQLSDLAEELAGDTEPDGYEALNSEDQDRVTRALAIGHIADEDKTSFDEDQERKYQDYLDDEERIKELKREAKANNETFSLKDTRARLKDERLSRYKMEKDEQKLAESIAKKAAKQAEKEAKKAGTKRKQVKTEAEEVKEENDDDSAFEEPVPKKRQRSKTKLVKTEDDEDDEPEKPLPKQCGRAKVMKPDESSTKAQTTKIPVRNRPTITREAHNGISDGKSSPEAAAKPKAKTIRGKKTIKPEPVGEDEGPAPKVKANNKKSARIKKQIKTEDENGETDGTGYVDTENSSAISKANPKTPRSKKLIKTQDDGNGNGFVDGVEVATNENLAIETNSRATRRSIRTKS